MRKNFMMDQIPNIRKRNKFRKFQTWFELVGMAALFLVLGMIIK